ncbi:MAG: hypothetical protein ABR941_02855 [Thermoleophilia bacterium]|jgi:hypothetical protein
MSAHDHNAGGGDKRLVARIRRRLTHATPQLEDCDHPHAHLVDSGGAGEQTVVLVCEECGRPLDAHDPTLRRQQRPSDARVCVDCGGTYWTVGTRRSV